MAVRRAANAGFSTLQLFTAIPQSVPHVKSGRLRVLAVAVVQPPERDVDLQRPERRRRC